MSMFQCLYSHYLNSKEKTFCLIFITFGLWFIWSLVESSNEKPVAYPYLFFYALNMYVCVFFMGLFIIAFDKPNFSAQTAIPLKFGTL